MVSQFLACVVGVRNCANTLNEGEDSRKRSNFREEDKFISHAEVDILWAFRYMNPKFEKLIFLKKKN